MRQVFLDESVANKILHSLADIFVAVELRDDEVGKVFL